MEAVVVSRVLEGRYIAHFEGESRRIPVGSSPEEAVGRLAKAYPERFRIVRTNFNLERPSREIGALVLANPDAFGAKIEIEEDPA